MATRSTIREIVGSGVGASAVVAVRSPIGPTCTGAVAMLAGGAGPTIRPVISIVRVVRPTVRPVIASRLDVILLTVRDEVALSATSTSSRPGSQ